MKRVGNEPAYALHRYPFSETSTLVELFTRHHGRVSVLAKGAKRPKSPLRAVLLPFQKIHVSYSSVARQTQVHTLRAAEWQGGHVLPTGQALLCGYYLNELLMRLLAREDPNEQVFDIYSRAVESLCTFTFTATPLTSTNANAPCTLPPFNRMNGIQGTLRAFELLLLRHIGVLPGLSTERMGLGALQSQAPYVLQCDRGLTPPSPHETLHALSGEQWQHLNQALNQALRQMHPPQPPYPTPHSQHWQNGQDGQGWQAWQDCVDACTPWQAQLKPQLRQLLQHHCGVRTLQTRQLMVDLQRL